MSESSQNEFENEDEEVTNNDEWRKSENENNQRMASTLFGEPEIKEDKSHQLKLIEEVTNTPARKQYQQQHPYDARSMIDAPSFRAPPVSFVPNQVPVCAPLSIYQVPQKVNSDTPISWQIESHNGKVNNEPYPVDAFPRALRNVITTLHEDTHIPIEMIGSTVLAALSLALQPLIDVESPFGNKKPEPCSLYFLTLAKSGEGKSPLRECIMAPFDEFASEMYEEYEELFDIYKKDYDIWSSKEKALNHNFQKAVKNGEDSKAEELLLREHHAAIPIKPKAFEMFYEDATPESIIQGLSEYPYAGVFSDEAITFFTGHLKNNLGLLNKIWKNEPLSVSRKKEGTIRLNAYLTFLLMVQPEVFEEYLKRHGKSAASSGFLARFLFTNTVSTIGQRKINLNQEKSKQDLDLLFGEFNKFLLEQKKHFYDSSLSKKTLTLTEGAKKNFEDKMNQYQSKISKNQPWEHISEFISKSGSHAIRIAALFECSSEKYISEKYLNDAFVITEWHLNQAGKYFYESSEQSQLRNDVYDLFEKIKKRFEKIGGKIKHINHHTGQTVVIERQSWQPFLKYELKQYAPGRLRGVGNKTEPAFEQLVGLGLIVTIRYLPFHEIYIAIPGVDQVGHQFLQNSPVAEYQLVQFRDNVERPLGDYDPSRLQWF